MKNKLKESYLDISSQALSPLNKKVSSIIDEYTKKLKDKLINKKVSFIAAFGIYPNSSPKKQYSNITVNDIQVRSYKDEYYVVISSEDMENGDFWLDSMKPVQVNDQTNTSDSDQMQQGNDINKKEKLQVPSLKEHIKKIINEILREDKFELSNEKNKAIIDTNWNSQLKYGNKAIQYADPKFIYSQGFRDGYDYAEEKYDVNSKPLNEAFSRQHYKKIADIIKKIKDESIKKELTAEFISLFKSDNPRFKEELFRNKINESADITTHNVIKKAWDSVKHDYSEQDYKVSGVPIMFVDGFKLGFKLGYKAKSEK
jgi:hypothetical protein